MYDINSNEIFWPRVKGNDYPCPRAASAVACDKTSGKVYLFGGRFKRQRLNDFYVGFMNFNNSYFEWTMIMEHTSGENCDTKPMGRSWHTMTLIDNGQLLIYGGFSEEEKPLNDCWILDLNKYEWTRRLHLDGEPRLWHSAHYIRENATVFLIGGCTKNIFEDDNVDSHPESIGKLLISPLALRSLCLDFIAKNDDLHGLDQIPVLLQNQIQFRKQYDSIAL